ncbi:MAG: 23S rRNA (uracil(1939)-C(5))-methyltransferase RlmD [Clostridia bacterium]|nr:23S rRNA (uracil(1939)-C(5))-methyltransferase RlmD [Clostridia bacterium]
MIGIISVNDKVKLDICDITVNGDGIGKTSGGYPLFVKGAITGDTIEAVVTKTNKTYGFAKLLRIIEPSVYRIQPKCPIAEQCGGCSMMHMNYDGQLATKSDLVVNNMAKIGGCMPGTYVYDGIIGADSIYNYRNKAQFPVGLSSNHAVCGFYERSSHTIVPVTDCSIQSSAINTAVNIVMEFINKYKISVYNEKSHKGIVRHIYVREGADSELMVVVVTNSKQKIPHSDELAQMLCNAVKLRSLVQNINTAKSNVVLGYENITLWGDDQIIANVDNIKFVVSPNSFFQVNYSQMAKLYGKPKEYANLTGEETVFDLYCGVGSISLFVADKAKKVIGVEIVEPAIENAKINSRLNGIQNTEFYCGDCGEVVDKLIDRGYTADVVIVDPPRKGCDEKTLSLINKIAPKRLVYVSCNSSTLARDVAHLREYGFTVDKICAVDMFPQTMHVETVVLLQRQNT